VSEKQTKWGKYAQMAIKCYNRSNITQMPMKYRYFDFKYIFSIKKIPKLVFFTNIPSGNPAS
jgi:hypothetical protein